MCGERILLCFSVVLEIILVCGLYLSLLSFSAAVVVVTMNQVIAVVAAASRQKRVAGLLNEPRNYFFSNNTMQSDVMLVIRYFINKIF